MALPCELARPGNALLEAAELQHFDPPPHLGQPRIDGQGGLERRHRVVFAVERNQPLTAAEECGYVLLIAIEHAVEMRQRRFRIFARQLKVAERGFSGIERLSRRRSDKELALRRFQVAGLKECPAADEGRSDGRIGIGRRNRRLREFRKLRHRDDRRRDDLGRASADRQDKRQSPLAHPPNITTFALADD